MADNGNRVYAHREVGEAVGMFLDGSSALGRAARLCPEAADELKQIMAETRDLMLRVIEVTDRHMISVSEERR